MRRALPGLILTVVSVALLVRAVDLDQTWRVLQRADALWISFAVMCLGGSVVAKSVRWRALLPASAAISTPRLFRILNVSYLLNNVLPLRLGDVARVTATMRQSKARLGHIISSMVTERVADALVLVTVFIIISPLLTLPARYSPWLHLAWLIIGIVLATAGLGVLARGPLRRLLTDRRIGGRLHPRIGEEARSFGEGVGRLLSWRDATGIWGWSIAAWGLAFALNYVLLRSLGIDAPWTVAVLITCTTNLAMLLPSSPGYVGVYHAVATLTLLPFGVGGGTALSFAILAHLVNVLPVSVMGAAFLPFEPGALAFYRQRKTPPLEEAA